MCVCGGEKWRQLNNNKKKGNVLLLFPMIHVIFS